MAAADLPGSDEERAEAALIAAAGKILRSDNREVPEDFVAALFDYAVPEDLLRYDPRQLAELAADAWSLLAVRKPGVPKIRLNAPDLAGHERLRADSVLEVVNDDMPFLVDSVLAELAERGLDVRRLPARCAKASSTYISSASRKKRAAPRSSRTSSGCSPTCASAFTTGGQ